MRICRKIRQYNFLYFTYGIDLSYMKDRFLMEFIVSFICKCFYRIVYSLLHFREHFGVKGKTVFYGYAESNLHTLKDVKHAMLTPAALVMEKQFPAEATYLFPKGISAFFSLILLPVSFLIYLNAYIQTESSKRAHFRKGVDSVFDTLGRFIATWIWMKFNRPKAIVTSCDHRYEDLIFFDIAKKMRIPTFYLQHASVNEKFPPLRMDYALLEGQDALEKYKQIGVAPFTETFLIGMPKFDTFITFINQNNDVKRIGYALNGTEKMENVLTYCQKIKGKFKEVELVVRPHPILYNQAEFRADYLALENQLRKIGGLVISDSRTQPVFEFLKEIDLLIAADSNIHLEATLLNVYSVYFTDSENTATYDWYGFLRNGMIVNATDCNHLLQRISEVLNHKPFVRNKAKFYCDTVNSERDGHSAMYTAELIQSLIEAHPHKSMESAAEQAMRSALA